MNFSFCGIEVPTVMSLTVVAGAGYLFGSLRHRNKTSRTKQELAVAEMRTDSLTGLKNRRELEQVLTTQLAMLGRYGTPCSLVLIDIDNFKQLNGQRGQLHGDHALQRMARLLTDETRVVDVLARSGGDEFIAVLPETEGEGARALAERLRTKVREQMPFTITLGVATAGCVDTPDSFVARAEAALRQAKAAGGNYAFCDCGAAVAAAR
jgi:diguanylate cyclase (GGDEF)-like protein